MKTPLKKPTTRPLRTGMTALALLLALPMAASAQLVNLDPVVDAVGAAISDGISESERLARDLERRAAQAARQAERRAQQQARQLSDTAQQVTGAATDTLRRIPVLNGGGAVALVEVEVAPGEWAVERQWLAMLDTGELALLQKLDIEILEQTDYTRLGLSLLRFRVPAAMDSRAALSRHLPASLVERFDRNHIFRPQNAIESSVGGDAPAEVSSICDAPVSIGMVDTAIQLDHPAFRGHRIEQQSFVDPSLPQPDAHGTAVAGVLIGAAPAGLSRLPKANLYNASVFYPRDQFAQGATMMHLVGALDWLLSVDVQVINMSLSGPGNRVLETALKRVLAQGKIVVAAAGNGGPAAPPLYPAAYPGVISATAVDEQMNVYRWANRGDYVDFAAYGVRVMTARSGSRFGRESGTSIAAPIVSAFAACEQAANPGLATDPEVATKTSSAVMEKLAARASDLGEPGRDPVFGYGFLD
ncbi:S8 family serine peptidase [Microbulbifer elongatus]|uniref:S8 family serine peptidase n=1 Tax=Microbulbifer elongatus TaxID=86173 RepID=A0ABT1P4G7_9GAMM|nr:S8 family serine peptidase [Microbulbifer elongatus]MCQ3830029.1 S8 family serine peptidase [Microbulbifer elongatus]